MQNVTGATHLNMWPVMWRMMQRDEPDDFVVATGETHTVREFVQSAFDYAGLDWREMRSRSTPDSFRPTEVGHSTRRCQQGSSRARLGSRMCKTRTVSSIMVDADHMQSLQDQLHGRPARQASVGD